MILYQTFNDECATINFAKQLASYLTAPLILTFNGHLGAGKTTFIRGMLRSLGIVGTIKSPTFSLVESYVCPKFTLHHFDLYRINNDIELESIGFREFFSENTVCCIEWVEKLTNYSLTIDIHSVLRIHKKSHLMELHALTSAGDILLTHFLKEGS